ncbi:MAG TPA: adenosylcobinamide-GDP ribazoletransferase [Streptosporangiaceae bacterium]|nr:adenosylcobinamide-GDP ribazoletransferase [Streptosporangiaceae bacterium]
MTMFTVVPVAGPADIRRDDAGRIVLWLPVLGGVLGAAAAGALLAVEVGGDSIARRLLAATVAFGVLGILTGGMHLDGLADTVDGLGSRRPRQEALDIMRRSDTGPMGVAALLFVVLVQVAALAVLPSRWLGAAAMILAVVTSRVAVLLAADAPAARPQGFGALIAGAATRRAKVSVAAVLAATVTVAGAAAGGPLLALRGLAAVAVALALAASVRRVAVRRLGGMTGDVFGAMIELSTAAVLLVLAVLS